MSSRIRGNKFIISAVILLVMLVALRAAAPAIMKSVVNSKLEETPGINGHVEDIDIALWRGAYKVNNLRLQLQENAPNVDSITVKTIDLSILWSALLRGSVVAEVSIDNAQLLFVDTAEKQDKLNENVVSQETWLTLINFASPITIDKVVISNTKATLRTVNRSKAGNDKKSPNVDNNEQKTQQYFIDDINGSISNITNSQEYSGSKITRFKLDGKFMGLATSALKGSLDPDTPKPTLDVNFEMQQLPISELDGLVDFYTPLDVEKGKLDAALELIVNNGAISGFVKAGIYDPEVFTYKGDIEQDDDGLLTGLFEGLIDGVAAIFESSENDLLAVNIPLSGTLDDTDVSILEAISSLFYNAFVEEFSITSGNSKALSDADDSEAANAKADNVKRTNKEAN